MISPTGTGSAPTYYNAPMRGINRAVEQINKAGQKIAEGDVSADNMVDMISSEKLMKASTVALRTQDEVIGSLLNVKV